MEPPFQEVLDALADMVNQHCLGDDGKLDSLALNTNADAMRLLARYDLIEIEEEHGRRVIGRWKPAEPSR